MGASACVSESLIDCLGCVELVVIRERIVDHSDFLLGRPKGFLDFSTMDQAFSALSYCCHTGYSDLADSIGHLLFSRSWFYFISEEHGSRLETCC